jgi:hypothetical protein
MCNFLGSDRTSSSLANNRSLVTLCLDGNGIGERAMASLGMSMSADLPRRPVAFCLALVRPSGCHALSSDPLRGCCLGEQMLLSVLDSALVSDALQATVLPRSRASPSFRECPSLLYACRLFCAPPGPCRLGRAAALYMLSPETPFARARARVAMAVYRGTPCLRPKLTCLATRWEPAGQHCLANTAPLLTHSQTREPLLPVWLLCAMTYVCID